MRGLGEKLMADCFQAVCIKDGETYYCRAEQRTEDFWEASVLKSPLSNPQGPFIGADCLEDAQKRAHDTLVCKLGLKPTTTLNLTWQKCPA